MRDVLAKRIDVTVCKEYLQMFCFIKKSHPRLPLFTHVELIKLVRSHIAERKKVRRNCSTHPLVVATFIH